MELPLCIICFGMYTEIKDPVCTSCGTIVCKVCMDTHMKYSNKCPKCRSQINGHIVTHKLCCDMLEKELEEKYKCPNSECKEIFQYKKIPEHIDNCAFSLTACINKECTEKVMRGNLDKHLVECNYRIVKCDTCAVMMPANKSEEHIRDACVFGIIDCVYGCKNKVQRCNMQIHLKRCLNRPIKCSNILCEKFLNGKDALTTHLAACPYTLVKCAHCDTILLNTDIMPHYNVCGKYPIKCELCETTYKREHDHTSECPIKKCEWCKKCADAKSMTNHEDICDIKPLKCAKCNLFCKRMDTEYHARTCAENEQKCRFGCGSTYKAKDETSHFEICPEVYTVCKYSKHGICYTQFPRKYEKEHDCDKPQEYDVTNPHTEQKFVPGLTVEIMYNYYKKRVVKKVRIYHRHNCCSVYIYDVLNNIVMQYEDIFPFGTFRTTTYGIGSTIYYNGRESRLPYKGVIENMCCNVAQCRPLMHPERNTIEFVDIKLEVLNIWPANMIPGMYFLIDMDMYKVIAVNSKQIIVRNVINYYSTIVDSNVLHFNENDGLLIAEKSNVIAIEYGDFPRIAYGIYYS